MAEDERSDETTMIEDFLDCTGKKRTFRLVSYAGGQFLAATELIDGEPIGIRFVEQEDARGILPWGKLRERIRARLAERDLAIDPNTGKLTILRDLIRGQLQAPEDYEADDGPVLLVDDRQLSWSELGRMLLQSEGCHVRLEILDPLDS